MSKNIRVRYAVAYFAGSVNTGNTIVKEGEGYQTKGIEITPDHKFLIVEPFGDFSCEIFLDADLPIWLIKLHNSVSKKKIFPCQIIKIIEKTSFPLNKVIRVVFNDGWDDSHYSFKKIQAKDINTKVN